MHSFKKYLALSFVLCAIQSCPNSLGCLRFHRWYISLADSSDYLCSRISGKAPSNIHVHTSRGAAGRTVSVCAGQLLLVTAPTRSTTNRPKFQPPPMSSCSVSKTTSRGKTEVRRLQRRLWRTQTGRATAESRCSSSSWDTRPSKHWLTQPFWAVCLIVI